MFRKLLIANRGEIACRVIRTARRMGLSTVAVHSDADAGALHVRMADEAVAIGGARPADSYLRIDRIVAAARATGAEAVHPGYGFLSENPDFVDAVEAAGLVFVGPSAAAIRAMGLKDAAKRLMQEAGVPVVPGYLGEDQSPARLATEAEAVGYPVLIKAVAGGGGKGMRLVERPGDFAEALDSARGEAERAFGNPSVLIEKFVTTPRHVEVQVFGDGTSALHLFERDCSLQRRHQKVLEEAPAPGMTAEVRAAMGAAAVRAAEAIGYRGAGTVEFIADAGNGLRPDGFWFMEMNTRLQVEHPVTEAITGIDLVEWQLRVAAGERLPARQEDLSIRGHAVEVRLYAEDVPAGFLPATGRIEALEFPGGLRADSGVAAGDAISAWYDPMIAKLVAHGSDRDEAFARLSRGLSETVVAGTVTNLAFLRALADHPEVRAGRVDTGLIGRDLAALSALPGPSPQILAQVALIASGLDAATGWETGFALWQPLAQPVTLDGPGGVLTAQLRAAGPDRCDVTVGGAEVAARRGPAGWTFDGHPAARLVRHGDRVTWSAAGQVWRIVDPLDRGGAAGPGGDAVLAPMPGLVRAVEVTAGAAVTEGARMLVLEAMKMEHVLRAPRDGIVAEVLATPGAQVAAGDLMALLEPRLEDR